VLHLRHGQYRVGLGVGAAVGDVHAGVAGQLLEQQAPQRPERPLAGSLILGTQRAGGEDVAAQDPLCFHEGVACRRTRGPW